MGSHHSGDEDYGHGFFRKRSYQHITLKGKIGEAPKLALEDLQHSRIEDLEFCLQSTLKVVIQRYKNKDELFNKMKGQLMKADVEMRQMKQERDKVFDDYHKTAKELRNTKQTLEQKNDQLKNFKTKFDKLTAELQNPDGEKNEKRRELDGLKKTLERKEIAFNRFIKEFNGEEQSCGQGEVSSKEPCDFDGSSCCSICMEPWTESGEHNICSLSCGHFFGRSCITKWINQATLGLSTCPQCLKSASLRDLRQHYVQRICIGDEKKIHAGDDNIPQRQQPLMVSRIVLSNIIENGQNGGMTNEEYEGVRDVGSNGAGGYNSASTDDDNDDDDDDDDDDEDDN